MNGKTQRVGRFLVLISTLVLLGLLAGPARAANVYWDIDGTTPGAGGATPDGAWDATSTNWSSAAAGNAVTAGWVANDSAFFAAGTDATGAYTVVVNGTNDIRGLTFQEGTVTIANGTTPELRLTANTTANVGAGLTATIAAPLTQDASPRQLFKTGTGTLILSSTNSTYTSWTIVQGGILRLGADNVINGRDVSIGINNIDCTLDLNGHNDTFGAITFRVSNGAQGMLEMITLNGGTLTLGANFISTETWAVGEKGIIGPGIVYLPATRTIQVTTQYGQQRDGDSFTISGDISGAPGAGLNLNSSFLVLSGTNTYDGDTTLNGNTVAIGIDPVGTVGAITSSAIGTGNLIFNGGGMASDSTTPRVILNPVTRNSGRNVGLGNATRNGKLTFAGTTTLVGSGTFTLNSDVDFDGMLTGGGWNKTGSGIMTLNNTNNAYTGASGVSAGVVRSGADNVIPDGSAIAIGATGTFDLNGFSDTVNGDGTRAIYLGVGAQPQLATLSTGAGTLTIGGNITTDSNAWGNHAITGNLNLGSATRSVTIGTSGNLPKKLSISANISGDPGTGINYTGVNTKLILSGANTYDGGATVGGSATLTFLNTAAQPSAGTTTVAALATLGLGVGAAPDYFTSVDLDDLFTNNLALVAMNATANVGIDTSAGNFEYASNVPAVIRGLTKLGLNTLTLSGDLAYTGPTMVDEGTLVLSGDNSEASGATTVKSGAVLRITAPTGFPSGALTLAGNLEYTGSADVTLGSIVTLSAAVTITISEAGVTLTLPGTTGGGSVTKDGEGTLVILGGASGTGGYTVNGGTVIFTEPQIYTGPTTVNTNGTLILRGGDHTLVVNQTMVVNGGTLDIEGNDQYVGNLSGTVGGTITGAGTLTVRQTAAQSFAGAMVDAVNLVKVGNQTLTLTGDSATTGTIDILGGGLTLRDAGALSATTGVAVNGATLTLDNRNGTQDMSGRLNDASVSLNGGHIAYLGGNATNATETLGAVTAGSGVSIISATPGTGTASAILTLSSLTRGTGAGLNVNPGNSSNLGRTTNPYGNIKVTSFVGSNLSDVNGVIPGVFSCQQDVWELVGYLDETGFGSITTAGYAGTMNNFAAATATDNVKFPTGTPTVSTNMTINSFNQGSLTFANGTATGGSNLLTIASGMTIARSDVWGTPTQRGRITSGTQELFILHRDGNATPDPICNAVIEDNGSPVSLSVYTKRGDRGYYLWLTAANTYSGGTFVSGGNTLGGVLLNATTSGDVVIPAGGLTIDNMGLVDMANHEGQIHPSNVVTINGYGQLNLKGNNTLAGIVFNSNGGTTAPSVRPYATINTPGSNSQAGRSGNGTLIITGNIASTPINVAVTPLIDSGFLDFNGTAEHDITVTALPQGNRPNNGINWAPLNGLQISSVIQNGGFTKKGDGVLNLTGNNTFDGQLTVEEGVLNVNAVNNVSTVGRLGQSALSVILGATGKAGTLEYTGGNAASTKPFTMAMGGTGVFQIDNAAATLTLSGSIAGDGSLLKTGPGTLSLTGAKSYTGDTRVEVGTLRIDSAYLDAGSDVHLTSRAVLNLNFVGTNDVSDLYMDGAPQVTGTYGASGSGADYESAYFAGAGLLNVTGFTPVAPTAFFSATPTNGVAPLMVTFTDSSTGTITNRYWDFGDGATLETTSTSVNHTYTNAGTYDVELIVRGQAGSSTNSKPGLIVVTAPLPPTPTPMFAEGAITFSGGDPLLSFDTDAGFLYGIEYRDSLIEGDWLPLIYDPDYPLPEGWSSLSTGGVMTILDTNDVNQTLRFYRLRATAP